MSSAPRWREQLSGEPVEELDVLDRLLALSRRAAERVRGGSHTRAAARHQPHRAPLDPVMVEEQAIAQLYGSRTGTVSSWTVRPPVEPQ